MEAISFPKACHGWNKFAWCHLEREILRWWDCGFFTIHERNFTERRNDEFFVEVTDILVGKDDDRNAITLG
jgi:hypothetical protein